MRIRDMKNENPILKYEGTFLLPKIGATTNRPVMRTKTSKNTSNPLMTSPAGSCNSITPSQIDQLHI